MAEEFLKKLDQLEERISGIGETLKRMITVLAEIGDIKAEMSEIKSAVQQSKVDIMTAIQSQVPAQPAETGGDEVIATVTAEFEKLSGFIGDALQSMKDELIGTMQAIPAAPAHAAVDATIREAEALVPTGGSLPVDRAMKVADQLEKILGSLKMGCVAKDVLEAMTDAKAEIMKIVPSDPIMVKIDKMMGIVGTYPKRNELQARDIRKLQKEIKEEIPKYRPA